MYIVWISLTAVFYNHEIYFVYRVHTMYLHVSTSNLQEYWQSGTKSLMFKVSFLCFVSPLISSLQLTRPPREVAAVVTVLSFWPVTLKNSNFVPSAPLLVRVNVLFKVSPITVVPKSIRHVSVDSCLNIFNILTLI